MSDTSLLLQTQEQLEQRRRRLHLIKSRLAKRKRKGMSPRSQIWVPIEFRFQSADRAPTDAELSSLYDRICAQFDALP
ncbi:MAG: hypothetical protein MHM6MM_005210 [Cercozoa sp. M6MM]